MSDGEGSFVRANAPVNWRALTKKFNNGVARLAGDGATESVMCDALESGVEKPSGGAAVVAACTDALRGCQVASEAILSLLDVANQTSVAIGPPHSTTVDFATARIAELELEVAALKAEPHRCEERDALCSQIMAQQSARKEAEAALSSEQSKVANRDQIIGSLRADYKKVRSAARRVTDGRRDTEVEMDELDARIRSLEVAMIETE